MKDWFPIIGVVVAQVVILVLFWLRQRADDNRRWHEKRLEAYRALAKAGRDGSLVFAGAEEPADLDDRRFVDAMNAADACALDIALLSSEPVRHKADELQTILEMCVVFSYDDEAFPAASDLLAARSDFEFAVRRELGVQKSGFSRTARANSRLGLVWQTIREIFRRQDRDYLAEAFLETLGAPDPKNGREMGGSDP